MGEQTMKALVVYYSRSGVTKKVGEAIAAALKCDAEEIVDTRDRSGALGYANAGKDAMFKRMTDIKPLQHNPAQYNVVIIGTPVWAWTMTPAVRTLITNYKPHLKNVAFFCTQGGSGNEGTFQAMDRLCDQRPLATLMLLQKEVSGDFAAKIDGFVGALKAAKLQT
jgi:flavodoxin